MAVNITSGMKDRPQKVCINGPEGVGKTTLAAALPSPIFLDAEGGTDHLDVNRVEISSMEEAREVVQYLKKEKHDFKTLVLDTIDWVEGKLIKEMCAEHNTDSITKVEGGYGKGFEILAERTLDFLSTLDSLRKVKGMHIVLLAHTKIQKFEDPQLAASYDRYQLKMEKKTSALIKEWVDALLFLNYDTKLADQKGTMEKKRGVQGKQRILHTSRTAAFDAKNRHGLPDEIKVGEENPAEGLLGTVFGSSGSAIIDNAREEFAKEQEAKSSTPRDQENDADDIPGLPKSENPIDRLVEQAGGTDLVMAFCASKGKEWDAEMQQKALKKPDAFLRAIDNFKQ